jgi:hypothetical protein
MADTEGLQGRKAAIVQSVLIRTHNPEATWKDETTK